MTAGTAAAAAAAAAAACSSCMRKHGVRVDHVVVAVGALTKGDPAISSLSRSRALP